MNGVAFVVEQTAVDSRGRQGTARLYVSTEERAQQVVAERPDIRTYRPIPFDEMPEAARANMLRAIAASG